ncbi:XdhC family protein [Natrinema halophilum]
MSSERGSSPVVDVDGSANRRPGAKMVIDEQGAGGYPSRATRSIQIRTP